MSINFREINQFSQNLLESVAMKFFFNYFITKVKQYSSTTSSEAHLEPSRTCIFTKCLIGFDWVLNTSRKLQLLWLIFKRTNKRNNTDFKIFVDEVSEIKKSKQITLSDAQSVKPYCKLQSYFVLRGM